ncbi:MAG TPA: carboxypeptidase-like regulatory domain-containing protein [Bacteroidota bacterium]|nr:carboxypeptidase-like regulatory domain-containing protein [Bacteroidota bacterium]
MKNLFLASALVLCSAFLHAQDRFFLYGKILGADGTPIPSAQVSYSTAIDRQQVASTEAGPDGSFRLVISGADLALLKFSAPRHDSLMLPLLLTTVQRTMSVTVRLNGPGPADSIPAQHGVYVPLHIKDENTELGIAVRLLTAMMEEKGLDSAGNLIVPGRGLQRRNPDSLLVSLSDRIMGEQDPIHREILLIRYIQVRANAKREGTAVMRKMALNLVEPASPLWSLVPGLLRTQGRPWPEFAEYVRRVRARTHDPELKQWIDAAPH